MTSLQVTINRDAGVAVLRTVRPHGKQPCTRSLFNSTRRQIIPLAAA
jgi:hypothetical protein